MRIVIALLLLCFSANSTLALAVGCCCTERKEQAVPCHEEAEADTDTHDNKPMNLSCECEGVIQKPADVRATHDYTVLSFSLLRLQPEQSAIPESLTLDIPTTPPNA